MTQAEMIDQIRSEIGDTVEPYRFDVAHVLSDAVRDYSRYRPRRRRGTLSLFPGIQEYPLPDDYQTWVSGLEGYEVLDSTLYLDSPPRQSVVVQFVYLANHTIESIPESDIPILLDYCMWKLLDSIVREGAEISGLKLGKGLEIKFDNFDQISKESASRQARYQGAVTRSIGVWS